MGTQGTVIKDNLIEWCGWADADVPGRAVGAKYYNLNLFHASCSLGGPTNKVLCWVETEVIREIEMKDVRLAVGSNAASVWWLNGEREIMAGLVDMYVQTDNEDALKLRRCG